MKRSSPPRRATSRAKTGETVTRQGKAILYTGFQWRGRSSEGAADQDAWREVMFVDRDQRELTGRWFTGGYDETGIDVTLTRIGGDPVVLGPRPPVAADRRHARGRNLRRELPGEPGRRGDRLRPGRHRQARRQRHAGP